MSNKLKELLKKAKTEAERIDIMDRFLYRMKSREGNKTNKQYFRVRLGEQIIS